MTTSISDFQSLAARVERLESQYHWLKSEVVTERVALVDADGRTRATLRTSEGVPSLILHDPNGTVRAILRVSAEGPALHLLGSKTKAVLELTVGEAGPDVSLFDASGNRRLTLDVSRLLSDAPEVPGLMMCDAKGTPNLVLRSLENSPSVSLLDSNNPHGNTSVQIVMESEGPSLVCVKDGRELWSAP